jgi:hypothetical protein
VDVRNNPCIVDGCSTRASFSFKGQPARFCANHKADGMCGRYTCRTDGCTVSASYATPGETTPVYCAAHRPEGMVNIRMRRCQYPGCQTSRSFGTTTPVVCKEHAEEGMRNLLATMCWMDGCTVQASYGLPGTRPVSCQVHSTDEMVCVIGKGCQHPGCTSRSRYYDAPGGKGRFCTRHREPGMVDVMNPKCDACGVLARYGLPGCKPSRCTHHRSPGMLSRPRARCVVCRQPAIFGTSFVATVPAFGVERTQVCHVGPWQLAPRALLSRRSRRECGPGA